MFNSREASPGRSQVASFPSGGLTQSGRFGGANRTLLAAALALLATATADRKSVV